MCAPVWTDSAIGCWSTYRSSGTPCARTRVHFWSHSEESAPQGGAGLVLQPGHCSANIGQSVLTSLMYLILWRALCSETYIYCYLGAKSDQYKLLCGAKFSGGIYREERGRLLPLQGSGFNTCTNVSVHSFYSVFQKFYAVKT
jgi:hypothetical protein